MGVDVSHLVLVTLGHANHQVLDDGLDSSQSSDVFPRAMVDFDLNELLSGLVLAEGECDSDVGEILCQFSYSEAKC